MPNDVTVKAAIDSKNLIAEKIVSLRQKIMDFAAKAKRTRTRAAFVVAQKQKRRRGCGGAF